MPEAYAGTPVDHAEITVPVGSDKPSGALFAVAPEQLLDKMLFIRNLQGGQITTLQAAMERGWADFAINDTVAIGNAWLKLVIATGATGAGANSVTKAAHTGTPTGDYFQLGDPSEDDANGLWEVEVEIHATATSTGVKSVVLYRHDGSTDPTSGETAVREFFAEGSGVVADTEEFTIRGTFRDFIPIPIGANAPRFSLKWSAGAGATLDTGISAPRIYVTQLNRLL